MVTGAGAGAGAGADRGRDGEGTRHAADVRRGSGPPSDARPRNEDVAGDGCDVDVENSEKVPFVVCAMIIVMTLTGTFML